MLSKLLKREIAILALVMGLALGALGSPIATAAPTLAQEEQRGEAIAESVRSGARQCSDLSSDDFELIGEYTMGRYLGDDGAHAAMNERMALMMGEVGERRMHTALGYRYTSCAGGPASDWVGPIAGMMGGPGSGGNGPGMMRGGEYRGGGYSGSMMGSGHHGGDVSMFGVVLIALAAAALGAGLVMLVLRRTEAGPTV